MPAESSQRLRRGLLGALQVLLLPLLLPCWLESRWGGGEQLFAACGELLSLVPGPLGSLLRTAFYRGTLQACAEQTYISFGALIVHRSAAVGREVYVGPYCVLGAVTLGDGVKIATRVSVTSGRRQHGAAPGQAATEAPQFEQVSIGAGAWIGEGAVVMADVGRNAVVGAGSVVVHPVADGATVVGNPAREVARAPVVASVR